MRRTAGDGAAMQVIMVSEFGGPVQARYFWLDAAQAHLEAERGHTEGKLVLVVDEDLAAAAGL
ncbi:MAG: hypothetical protein JO037_24765 [Actinobacteria bacterium]|nr:hypothetical protein [Actinomycetota bacterium]